MIRVLTYNIHHGEGAGGISLTKIAAVIRKSSPDLVALQEVDMFMPRSFFANQARRLAKMLGLQYVFGRAASWLIIMRYGNAVLLRGTILQHNNLVLTKGRECRALLRTRIKTGQCPAFHFLNTHLGLSSDERRAQADKIAQVVSVLKGPVVLAGDFNAGPEAEEFKSLNCLLNFSALTNPTYPSHEPVCFLDNILVSRHWSVLRAATVKSLASDHLPLIVDLEYSSF
ncbi:MAG: Endonuclease/exonuclease/phosphatase [Desulfotomaculum sp. 46_296]|nr:MAG: Endonuclease/exonuclease/phosphatase [Desulfotomaculum sp. 46_296]HAU30715.1 endonuclease [Desulfotomaculum sp.]